MTKLFILIIAILCLDVSIHTQIVLNVSIPAQHQILFFTSNQDCSGRSNIMTCNNSGEIIPPYAVAISMRVAFYDKLSQDHHVVFGCG